MRRDKWRGQNGGPETGGRVERKDGDPRTRHAWRSWGNAIGGDGILAWQSWSGWGYPCLVLRTGTAFMSVFPVLCLCGPERCVLRPVGMQHGSHSHFQTGTWVLNFSGLSSHTQPASAFSTCCTPALASVARRARPQSQRALTGHPTPGKEGLLRPATAAVAVALQGGAFKAGQGHAAVVCLSALAGGSHGGGTCRLLSQGGGRGRRSSVLGASHVLGLRFAALRRCRSPSASLDCFLHAPRGRNTRQGVFLTCFSSGRPSHTLTCSPRVSRHSAASSTCRIEPSASAVLSRSSCVRPGW